MKQGTIKETRGRIPATATVHFALTDGSHYRVELPTEHTVTAALVAYALRPAAAPQPAQLLQIPLDQGNAALTFSTRDLAQLTIEPALLLQQGQRTAAPSCDDAREELPEALPPRSSLLPRTDHGSDPLTNMEEAHLGGYIRALDAPVGGTVSTPHGDPATWYPALWQWLIDELGVESMLEVGCGEGHTAGFFRDAGCEVLGVDGSILARAESVIPDEHVVHDFVDGPFVPDRRFDLVWSCEFVEHVEERFTHNFLAAFASSRKYLLITFAPPDREGWHHVNCRPQGYWIEKIERLGFRFEPGLTRRCRELAGRPHFSEHGLAFVRSDDPRNAISITERAQTPLRLDPLPINPMEVARVNGDPFLLFLDIFVHATCPVVVAISSYYGDDWVPADHGVDYDAVDLVLPASSEESGSMRVRGLCHRHRLDSWEPCIVLEFDSDELAKRIRAHESIAFRIEVGEHSQNFELTTRPHPPAEVAMSLVVRDENRWLPTFLEYYLHILKAQHVFVYDNGTSEGEKLLSILQPYRERGEVTYIPWDVRWRNRKDRKMIGQPTQESHSLARFANCEWIGFLDIDELLRLPDTTLPAFLLRFREAAVDGLSFGIRWFSYKGPLGFDEVEDAPLTYLYTRRDELGRKRQKLFVRGATVRFMRLHWLEEGARELPIDDTDIFFHHYEQRSYRFEDGKKAQATRDPYMLRFADRLSLADPPPRPSSEEEWIEHINAAIESAEQCRSRLSAEALAVDGMCGRYTRHFYNNLCRFKSCRYLEIGSYHGASTCAAIYANDVSATCIDNWSEFRGKRHHFEAAIGAHRGKADVEVIESDCFDLDASKLGPFDVYLYDGNHSQRSQYLAIERFVPALAEYGVVVIDDWNRAPVRQGTEEAIRALRLDVPFRREIAPPAEDCADANREKGSQTWWNGLCIMLVRRPSP